MSLERQDKALREFKQIIADLVTLLRTSTGAELAYMCWVNHQRQQFVWETHSTDLRNVMFQDRVNFTHHFLEEYKKITEIQELTIGEDIPKGKLAHYFDFVNASSMILIPFINNGETVAITVLEANNKISLQAIKDQVYSYNNALVNVLNTYLEIVNLHDRQNEWDEYELSLNKLDYRMHRVEMLSKLLEEIQSYLPSGKVSLVCPGMDSWNVVLNSKNSVQPPMIGLKLEERSAAYDAIEKGEPVFKIHFNNNPKLISSKEMPIDGASLCIPVMVHDRRQAVIVSSDKDALNYKESTKHKLINLVRIASLSIQSVTKKSGMADELFTQNFGAFMTELWESTIDHELNRLDEESPVMTWFGLISPEDPSTLRTRFRLDDLQKLQTDFVSFLNPTKHGVNGYIGYNSDYVYSFIIQSKKVSAVNDWMDSINTKLAHGFKTSSGSTIDVAFKAGYTKLTTDQTNSYQVLTRAKKALSEVVKNEEMELFEA